MNIRKIITAAVATGILAAGFSVAAPAPAEAAPASVTARKWPWPDGKCWPLRNGHTLCLIWQYRCPSEPFGTGGAIPACKKPGEVARKYWRFIYY